MRFKATHSGERDSASDPVLSHGRPLSQAAIRMLASIAASDLLGKCAPAKCIDFRVHPTLVHRGLVAHNLYEGICFTPKGRALWNNELAAIGRAGRHTCG